MAIDNVKNTQVKRTRDDDPYGLDGEFWNPKGSEGEVDVNGMFNDLGYGTAQNEYVGPKQTDLSNISEADARSMLTDCWKAASPKERAAVEGWRRAINSGNAQARAEAAAQMASFLEAHGVSVELETQAAENTSDAEVADEPAGDLKSQIKESKLPDDVRKKLLNKLEKAEKALALNADDYDAQSIIEEVQTEFQEMQAQPEAVQKLVTITGRSVSEIESAAEDAGIDLENLPTPPDSKVQKFIASFADQDLLDDYTNLEDKFYEDVDHYSKKAEEEITKLRASSEYELTKGTFDHLWKAWKGEDATSKKMMTIVKKQRDHDIELYSALGYPVSAGSGPDEIILEGKTYHSFDYESQTPVFSSEELKRVMDETYFAPTPRNLDSTSDERESWSLQDKNPEGYPEVSFYEE